MYYNSNKNNNDYYNSYKKELAQMQAYRKTEDRQKIIKLILIILAFSLFVVASFYLYKHFTPILDSKSSILKHEKVFLKNEQLPNIVIKETSLPQSVQLRESSIKMAKNIHENATDTTRKVAVLDNQKITATMNEKDIALIVKIIMSQMNTKIEKPLEKQLTIADNKVFTKKSLAETNHYNKVILTKNELTEVQNASLVELSNSLNDIMNEEIDASSNYTQSITKEVRFRTNEMRVVIVQRGDTLSKIAKKAYGNRDDYSKIFSANPEIIKNPNQIFVGQRLRIPA